MLPGICKHNADNVGSGLYYRSVLGKCPWALKHKSQLNFWPAWALTRDIISIFIFCIETAKLTP